MQFRFQLVLGSDCQVMVVNKVVSVYDADIAVVGTYALFAADAVPDDLVVVTHLNE